MIYLKWKGSSDDGMFTYYDKEAAENKTFDLKEFTITEKPCFTVMGWDEDNNSAIWSNDITNFKDETFNIKSGAGTLYEGVYNKEKTIALGAKIHIKLTCVQGGQEFSLPLKGMNFFKISELIKSLDITKDTISFTGFTDEKTGAVKYRAPVFVKGTGKVESKEGFEDLAHPF